MKKILVIGATGQIGSALMTKLRKEYGNDNVVAGYIEGVPLSDELKNGGPLEIADVPMPNKSQPSSTNIKSTRYTT